MTDLKGNNLFTDAFGLDDNLVRRVLPRSFFASRKEPRMRLKWIVFMPKSVV